VTWFKDASNEMAMFHLGSKRGERFVIADLVLFAHQRGFQRPKDNRAWGPVVQRAADCGLIKKVGMMPAFWRNGAKVAVWQAN